jgi:hypothetical protein
MEPYLEKLSAIHANPDNNPRIDSLFNEFQFHVNPSINQRTEYKRLYFSVNTAVPWVQNLKNSNISGYEDLDVLFTTYQFIVEDFYDFNGNTFFLMITNFNYLNIQALLDDLVALDDIDDAFLGETGGFGLNYTGVPYVIQTDFGSDYAEACDISIFLNSPETYVGFLLMGGGCAAGCIFDEYRFVSVSDDCQTIQGLGVTESSFQSLVLSPNPVSDKLHIVHNGTPIVSYTIYSVDGKIQNTANYNHKIDVSTLNSGMYFIRFISEEGTTSTKKFIKN